ncbi:50S ribosomal protein L2 [Candidatus Omnitrophota bacterium]
MGVKRFRPTTSSLRTTIISDFKDITKKKPEKRLLEPLKKSGGRNSYGRITARGRGGGHKRLYRIIDFKRQKIEVSAKVIAIEYDPNRSCRIALIEYPDKERNYVLAPLGLGIGDEIISSKKADIEIKSGNCLTMRNIPLGTAIHNLELAQGRGGQIVRSAGSSAQIVAKENDFAQVRLPSGEVRMFSLDCKATIGQLGNTEHSSLVLGKAGRSRWLGRKHKTRGVVMNPHDHPHGGGEGKKGQGNPHPVTPWGKPTKGYKTRKLTKYSDKFIVKKRT